MDTEKTRALAESIGSWLNPKYLINSVGLIGVWAIIFAETGLLVGFFFPGDSLIFLAGVASSKVGTEIVGSHLPLGLLLIVTPICAIAGAQLGHYLGYRYGPKMFNRPDSRLFKREYVERAEHYFVKFGAPKAIVLARFIPIVRTFLNPVAGVLRVPPRRFFVWNLVGGLIWTDGILLIGYFLARQIVNAIGPDKIDTYLLPVVLLIVLISMIPIFVEVAKARRENKRAAAAAAATPPAEGDTQVLPRIRAND